MTEAESTSGAAESFEATTVVDISPFDLDPIFMARLQRNNVKRSTVAIVGVVGTWVAITWCALASELMYDHVSSADYFRHLAWFVRPTGVEGSSVPLLADVPSMIMALTIPVSFAVVYDLYLRVAAMHTALDANGCMTFTSAGESKFNSGVEMLNSRLRRWGRFSLLALVASAGLVVAITLGQRDGIFGTTKDLDLYAHWWASLDPFRPGAIVWIVLGTIGVYVVYIEAVLGFKYVQFIREYFKFEEFTANPLNPDGYYGWRGLREVLTNMEVGFVLTGLSSLAMWPFLSAAFGVVGSAFAEVVFIGVVAYVFAACTIALRSVVDRDRRRQVLAIGRELGTPSVADDSTESAMRGILAYQRLALVERLPRSPLRRGSIAILTLTLLAPLLEIVVAVLRYLQEGS